MSAIDLGPRFRQLNETLWVGPQISVEDIDRAADQGFARIICNRPDGEDPGQLPIADIAAAAEARGLEFTSIPVTTGFSEEMVEDMADALDGNGQPVLAYCRSGNRSTLLSSLALASRGADPETLDRQAAQAGYSIDAVRPAVDALSARSNG